MKFLHTLCFVAVVLGSTAALPAHEEDPKLDTVDFTKVKKSSVSPGINLVKISTSLLLAVSLKY
jgi:hypothetical protein